MWSLGEEVLSLSLMSGGQMRGLYWRKIETILIVESYFLSVFVKFIRNA